MAGETMVDANGEDEQAMGFHAMIEDNLDVPFRTSVPGAEVTGQDIEFASDNTILAVCAGGAIRQAVPVVDLPLPGPAPAGGSGSRPIAAGRGRAVRFGRQGDRAGDGGPPGSELQIDFGDLGPIPAGNPRWQAAQAAGAGVHRLLLRYMFVYLTFSMTLEEVIAGCEDAWQFFSGVFRVVIPDSMSPVVARADAVNPQLTREWLEYAQARGFVTDPARVRHPRG
jgi:hypothetical protein